MSVVIPERARNVALATAALLVVLLVAAPATGADPDRDRPEGLDILAVRDRDPTEVLFSAPARLMRRTLTGDDVVATIDGTAQPVRLHRVAPGDVEVGVVVDTTLPRDDVRTLQAAIVELALMLPAGATMRIVDAEGTATAPAAVPRRMIADVRHVPHATDDDLSRAVTRATRLLDRSDRDRTALLVVGRNLAERLAPIDDVPFSRTVHVVDVGAGGDADGLLAPRAGGTVATVDSIDRVLSATSDLARALYNLYRAEVTVADRDALLLTLTMPTAGVAAKDSVALPSDTAGLAVPDQVDPDERPAGEVDAAARPMPVPVPVLVVAAAVLATVLAFWVVRRRRSRRPDARPAGLDRPATVVALAATALSVVFAVLTYRAGEMLVYYDSVPHLQIARRVVDSTSPGFAQLGGVWLPLPHLLNLPLVWLDSLYYSGWAGTVVSMASYVAASVLLYAIVCELTGSRAAAVVGGAVFMLNPNVLYMQSTPMTELLLFVGLLGMVRGMQLWIRTDRYGYLLLSGVGALVATLTRYEGWVLLGAMFGVLVVVAWRRGFARDKVEGIAIAFATLAGIGIVGWLVWNQVIFGSALNFQSGEYAKPSLWLLDNEPAIGDWWLSLSSYAIATVDNLGLVTVLLGLAGGVLLVVTRRWDLPLLPTASLVSFFPFFVVALYLGQRPLHVPEIHGELYNVRFGLVMVLPAAILVGYLIHLAGERYRTLPIAGGALVVVALASLFGGSVVTRDEPIAWEQLPEQRLTADAGMYLREHYAGGKVLMEAFGNDHLIFDARVDPDRHVYEGSYRQWEPALADPIASDIEWIVMRTTPGATDKVAEHLQGSTARRGYELAYSNDRYALYKRR